MLSLDICGDLLQAARGLLVTLHMLFTPSKKIYTYTREQCKSDVCPQNVCPRRSTSSQCVVFQRSVGLHIYGSTQSNAHFRCVVLRHVFMHNYKLTVRGCSTQCRLADQRKRDASVPPHVLRRYVHTQSSVFLHRQCRTREGGVAHGSQPLPPASLETSRHILNSHTVLYCVKCAKNEQTTQWFDSYGHGESTDGEKTLMLPPPN